MSITSILSNLLRSLAANAEKQDSHGVGQALRALHRQVSYHGLEIDPEGLAIYEIENAQEDLRALRHDRAFMAADEIDDAFRDIAERSGSIRAEIDWD
jgi:hypothetical protein